MTNLKIFNLKTHRDEGQVLVAETKLYQDGPKNAACPQKSDPIFWLTA